MTFKDEIFMPHAMGWHVSRFLNIQICARCRGPNMKYLCLRVTQSRADEIFRSLPRVTQISSHRRQNFCRPRFYGRDLNTDKSFSRHQLQNSIEKSIWRIGAELKQLGLCLTAQAAPDFCHVLWYLWTFGKYLWTEKRFWRLNRDTLSERVRAKLRAAFGGRESIFSGGLNMPIRLLTARLDHWLWWWIERYIQSSWKRVLLQMHQKDIC